MNRKWGKEGLKKKQQQNLGTWLLKLIISPRDNFLWNHASFHSWSLTNKVLGLCLQMERVFIEMENTSNRCKNTITFEWTRKIPMGSTCHRKFKTAKPRLFSCFSALHFKKWWRKPAQSLYRFIQKEDSMSKKCLA